MFLKDVFRIEGVDRRDALIGGQDLRGEIRSLGLKSTQNGKQPSDESKRHRKGDGHRHSDDERQLRRDAVIWTSVSTAQPRC